MSTTFPVPVVFVYRRFCPSESATMSRKAVASESPGEDFSEQGTSSAVSVVTDPSSIASPSYNTPGTVIKSVWDCEKIEKRGGPDAFSKCWHCGWCGTTLKGWNATKALNHISKASGNNDVKPCSGAIPKATLALFKAMNYQKKGAASVKRQHKDAFAESISENQQSIAVMFEAARSRTSNSSSAAAPIDMTGNCLEGTGVAAKNSTRLTSAIAEFIYSKGLSFSATEGEHFMQILRLSRLVPSSYRPPTRKALSNELLDVCYDMRLEKYYQMLDVDAEVYGLSLFGDGATVHGMPLMNILASGVGEPSAVLAIVDCKSLCVCVFCVLLPITLTIFVVQYSLCYIRYQPSR
jgi:hypothetical protein